MNVESTLVLKTKLFGFTKRRCGFVWTVLTYIQSYDLLKCQSGHEDTITCLVVEDGYLYSTAADKKLLVWDKKVLIYLFLLLIASRISVWFVKFISLKKHLIKSWQRMDMYLTLNWWLLSKVYTCSDDFTIKIWKFSKVRFFFPSSKILYNT